MTSAITLDLEATAVKAGLLLQCGRLGRHTEEVDINRHVRKLPEKYARWNVWRDGLLQA